MRELKLRYFIDLASNIAAKAQADAKALTEAQKVMQGTITGTNSKLTDWNALSAKTGRSAEEMKRAITGATDKFSALDRVISKVGTNTSTERQIGYMRQLAASVDQAQSKASRLAATSMTLGKVGVAGFAAYQAAKAVVAEPLKKERTYGRQLADMANTAYADTDVKGRIAGIPVLNASITDATRKGGGTREQSAEALDTLVASGVVSLADSIKMLPGITKAATASTATPKELATIGIRSNQNFKVDAGELPKLLGGAMVGGQAGGFELKDMAKWLPQQMAAGGNLGMSGKEGFAKLVAWNQASVITAGTKDEAGNNLKDLLNELNTPHFKDFMAKELLNGGKAMKKGDKLGKQKQIDDVYLDYQAQGVDKVSATIDLLDKQLAKNPAYAKLQDQLKATPKEDTAGRRSILESMSAQVQGSETGKIFHNQQSMMGFLALSNNREYTAGVLDKVHKEYAAPAGTGAVDIAHRVVASTNDFKMQQADNEKLFAQTDAVGGANVALGKFAELTTSFYQQYPSFSSTLEFSKLAVGGLAAAAGVASAALMLVGGGGLKGLLTKGAAAVPAAAPLVYPTLLGATKTAATVAAGASKMGAMGLLGKLVGAANPLMMIEALTGPSESDIDRLRAMDREKGISSSTGKSLGHRGEGFVDPRRLDQVSSELVSQPVVVPSRQAPGYQGMGFTDPRRLDINAPPQNDFMAITAPGTGTSPLKQGQQTEIKLGEGRLQIGVQITDERVLVTPTVTQQPAMFRIEAGNTNPAGLKP